jgi:hypothetical protein
MKIIPIICLLLISANFVLANSVYYNTYNDRFDNYGSGTRHNWYDVRSNILGSEYKIDLSFDIIPRDNSKYYLRYSRTFGK